MRHNVLKNGNFNHYAVGVNSEKELVLFQLQEDGNQVRIAMTVEEALHLSLLVLTQVKKIKEASIAD